jgi:hypothetical protein
MILNLKVNIINLVLQNIDVAIEESQIFWSFMNGNYSNFKSSKK